MTKERKKQWLIRGGLGALAGMLLVPLAVELLLNLGWPAPETHGVTPAMAARFGPAGALLLQCLLSGLFGGAVGVSTLPFADEGPDLLRRSLTHFGVTLASFLLMGRVCRWWQNWQGAALLAGLLALLYFLIWLARYAGWYGQVAAIRRGLGLLPGPSLLKWRESLPYLAFALVLCDLVPLILRGVELAAQADVPALTGVVLPFLVLPVAGFVSGLSLGKRHGFAPLYPPGCALLYLPMVLLLYNLSALFHCWVLLGTALLGNGAGTLIRWNARRR